MVTKKVKGRKRVESRPLLLPKSPNNWEDVAARGKRASPMGHEGTGWKFP